MAYCLSINLSYLEHDVARGILKFQCKTWEFRATSCSRHSDLFIQVTEALMAKFTTGLFINSVSKHLSSYF